MKNRRKSDAEVCEGVVESRKKLILSRSGSYPTANESCNRLGILTPSKLENKLIDVWPSGSSSASLRFHPLPSHPLLPLPPPPIIQKILRFCAVVLCCVNCQRMEVGKVAT